MSNASWQEMEAKRQEMIASFKDLAAVMSRCVTIIEDYARLTPSNLSLPMPNLQHVQSLPNFLPNAAELASFQALMAQAQAQAQHNQMQQLQGGSRPSLGNSSSIGGVGQGVGVGSPMEMAKKEKKKRERKPRDPNAPKRPPSAYIMFQNEVRDQMRKTNPEIAYKEVLGMISQKWKDLSDEQKRVYETEYAKQVNGYNTSAELYKRSNEPSVGPITAPVRVAQAESDSSDSDSDTSSSDDEPPPKPKPVPISAPVLTTPIHAPISISTPATFKKEKKRKSKMEEGVVANMLEASVEKKKKKKKDHA
ncbi:hypothetical protein M231_02477 [Tremella mesenterica]|uniref:HMG box domain-containing protein n=1 Tax=Tremella mesenterica TaxID=5217 RepID=A0A4Q1BQJ8_TREME|nr:hypothetical protein M231_02477 [Tremella mesenterica]